MSDHSIKIFSKVARVLFILALPGVLITGGLGVMANNTAFYDSSFAKYEISQSTGIAPAELHKVATGIISYINSSVEYIDIVVTKDGQPFTLFNDREVLHMKDVKSLAWLDYRFFGVCLALVLIYLAFVLVRREREKLASAVFRSSFITLGVMAALGIASLLNFDQLFLEFHILSFTNLLWQLDPATDYMIRIFNQGFFYDFVLWAFGIAAGLAVLLGAVSYFNMRKQTSPRKEKGQSSAAERVI